MNEKTTKYIVKGVESGNTYADCNSLMAALNWIDCILSDTKEFSLMTALNNIQADIVKDGKPVYEYKDQIPLSIINLGLKLHGLAIEEV